MLNWKENKSGRSFRRFTSTWFYAVIALACVEALSYAITKTWDNETNPIWITLLTAFLMGLDKFIRDHLAELENGETKRGTLRDGNRIFEHHFRSP